MRSKAILIITLVNLGLVGFLVFQVFSLKKPKPASRNMPQLSQAAEPLDAEALLTTLASSTDPEAIATAIRQLPLSEANFAEALLGVLDRIPDLATSPWQQLQLEELLGKKLLARPESAARAFPAFATGFRNTDRNLALRNQSLIFALRAALANSPLPASTETFGSPAEVSSSEQSLAAPEPANEDDLASTPDAPATAPEILPADVEALLAQALSETETSLPAIGLEGWHLLLEKNWPLPRIADQGINEAIASAVTKETLLPEVRTTAIRLAAQRELYSLEKPLLQLLTESETPHSIQKAILGALPALSTEEAAAQLESISFTSADLEGARLQAIQQIAP